MQDLTGRKFGKLTVVKLHRKEQAYLKNGQKNGFRAYYLCQCECGNTAIIQDSSLIGQKTKSCGCLQNKNSKIGELNRTHGKTKTRLYKIWQKIKERCNNSHSIKYMTYGGRGIKVCDEWLNDFMTFYKWAMANGYEENLTIDRIDVNGNYEPSNCRWATYKEQANNTRSNLRITYKGNTKTLNEWADLLNFNPDKIRQRIKKLNWSIERAFNTP